MLFSADRPIACLSAASVLELLKTSSTGLSEVEAKDRLLRFGANQLPQLKKRSLWFRFVDQLRHFMALMLWAAGAMAFIAGTPELGWAIWSVILINGVFSFWQEFQAERTLEALTRVLPQQVKVRRQGSVQLLPAIQLVPGDLIELEQGDHVPADCRVLQASELYLDVALLTGESVPVARHGLQLSKQVKTTEAANLLPAGTTVAAGRASAVVYATGAETEFGQVAHLTATTQRPPSTLEGQIRKIVRTITSLAVGLGVGVFLASSLLVGMGVMESLVFAIGIIVAMVPEGLLPTVTLVLALAVKRMAKQNALVQRLSAVETLGSVGVICTDKTGTLTSNVMTVQRTWMVAKAEALLLLGAALCSNAHLAVGDPTETALLVAALGAGLELESLKKQLPRLQELPFDSERRMMSVLLDWQAQPLWPEPVPLLQFTKGAPVDVLTCSSGILVGGPNPLAALDEKQRASVLAANDDLARQGYRVLAVAARPCGGSKLEENELVFLGLIALYDPPRPGVKEAIGECQRAGLKVTMMTGDYGLTAEAIARQIGLLGADSSSKYLDPVRVINGDSLTHISDVQLRQLIKYRSHLVFARMAPEQKLRLVQAYKALGEVVAVTGDGVNDAPALRVADVGIAMGQHGTDVAREAADIVLLDDNFATIVMAVRQGRAVVQNLRKFMTYILASNVPEVTPFLAMVAFRLPAALTVLQILAVDLGTDLLPALGLGAEAADAAVMDAPPRRRDEAVLNRPLMLRAFLFLGLIEAMLAMAGYLLTWQSNGISWQELRSLAPSLLHHTASAEVQLMQRQASAVTLGVIVMAQVGNLITCRSERQSVFSTPLFNNALLWLGIGVALLAYGALLLLPGLSDVFQMAAFPPIMLGWLLIAGPVVLMADEARKAWVRRKRFLIT